MKKAAFIGKSFTDSDFVGGGAQKFYFELIKRLIDEKFVIDIYCNNCEIKSIKINKVFVIEEKLNFSDITTIESFYDKVENLIKDEKYDYIFSEGYTPAFGINFIQYHSNEFIFKLKKPLIQFFERFFKQKRFDFERNCFKRDFRKLFVVSNTVKKDICSNCHIPEDKISVLYPGVNVVSDFSNKKPLGDTFTFGISSVGIVAKGGYIFLKALKILKKRGYKFRAKFIYPNHKTNLWLNFLVWLYGVRDNIDFLSYQNNMGSFYSSIDCLVMPSLREAFGLVALEAMGNKKTVIVSSTSGVSEILLDGIEGHIFSMGKKAAYKLAEKMEYVMNNPDKISFWEENAYKKAQEFTWDRTFKQLIEELVRI